MTDKIPVPPVGAAPATAEHFQVASQRPAVKFLSRGVQPPSQVYVTNQDVLTLLAASSQTAEAITVTYRLLRADGELISGQFIFPITGDNNLNVKSEPLAEGFLLSLAVQARGATTRGQTFARLFLQNPSLGVLVPSYMLMADYVTTAMSAAYPNGRVLMPTEGPGFVHGVAIAQPAAGTSIFIDVPNNVRWRLITAFGTLTTSAVGPARDVLLNIFANGLVIYDGGAGKTQPAGVGFSYTWAAGVPPMFDGVTEVIQPLPNDFILPPVANIEFNTFFLDAADQWTSGAVLVEEWLDNV